MKARRVYPYSRALEAAKTERDKRQAWQAFYDAAGLLGIELVGDWRGTIESAFTGLLTGGYGEATLSFSPPTVGPSASFEPFDPTADYSGEGLR